MKQIKKVLKKIYYEFKYRGKERFCPVCKKSASEFLIGRPYLNPGGLPREDSGCPFCRSLERHRLFWLYLERQTDFFVNHPKNFLHVAPEPILERRFRKTFKTGYLTSDLFSPDVDVKMDITDIRYPDDTFDFIYCSHVLEHVAEDRKAMAELARVLKTGGTGIFLVPITVDVTVEDESIVSPEERLKHYGQEDHVRRYGNDYIDRLRSAGFVVSKIEPKDFLSAEEIQNMGITKASGDIFSCTL